VTDAQLARIAAACAICLEVGELPQRIDGRWWHEHDRGNGPRRVPCGASAVWEEIRPKWMDKETR